MHSALPRALFICAALALGSRASAQSQLPPIEFTIAFIGDQGMGPDARAVLELIRGEGADAVVHSGDFDYDDDPRAWDAQISSILGEDFPYFASIGNHDTTPFFFPGGYQDRLEARMRRLGIDWDGQLGIRSALSYQGIFITLTAPGIFLPLDPFHTHDHYVRDQLAASDSVWRISSWHKNMHRMQVGGKPDETGWGVYEESRRGGAIIATGHEHSYSRTHLLASFPQQSIASTDDTLRLRADDPGTALDEGRSFAFVSGLGGRSVRPQQRGGAWWASIYTADQGARPGALFGVFHYAGNPRLAYFYFKDVEGVVADEFFVESTVVPEPGLLLLQISALVSLAWLARRRPTGSHWGVAEP